jgi:DNA modification methylase
MKTESKFYSSKASDMGGVEDSSVELVVTSPPYPMVEMWDDQFKNKNNDIEKALYSQNGKRAFELMHRQIDKVWKECDRVLCSGGVICVNIGDATRKIGDTFEIYPNHSRITEAFQKMGFQQIPGILWHKPTNSAAKFMGSGMLPVNAYPTLEHEHILIFKKPGNRNFLNKNRKQSAYFWEERNRWFTDLWTDIVGVRQNLPEKHQKARKRSAAFPIDIPLRLINMFSVYGDTVLDPFSGTGTTQIAAAVCGRNSIGYDKISRFVKIFNERVETIEDLSRSINEERIKNHISFIENRKEDGKRFKHKNQNYGFDVISSQEQNILLYSIDTINKINANKGYFEFSYEPFSSSNVNNGRLEQYFAF